MNKRYLQEHDIIYPEEIELETDTSFSEIDSDDTKGNVINDPISSGRVPLLYRPSDPPRSSSSQNQRKKKKVRKRKRIIIRKHNIYQRRKRTHEDIRQPINENLKESREEDVRDERKSDDDTSSSPSFSSPSLSICCVISIYSSRKPSYIIPDLRVSRIFEKAEHFVIEWKSKSVFHLRGSRSGLYLSSKESVQSGKRILGLEDCDSDAEPSERCTFRFSKHKIKSKDGCVSIRSNYDNSFLSPTDLSFTKNEPKSGFQVFIIPKLVNGKSIFIQLQSRNYKRLLVSESKPHGVSVTCSYLPDDSNTIEKRTLFRIYPLQDNGREFLMYTIFGSHLKCDEEGVIEETIEDPNELRSKLVFMFVGEEDVVVKEMDHGYLESRSDSEGRVSLGSSRVGHWELFKIRFFVASELM